MPFDSKSGGSARARFGSLKRANFWRQLDFPNLARGRSAKALIRGERLKFLRDQELARRSAL